MGASLRTPQWTLPAERVSGWYSASLMRLWAKKHAKCCRPITLLSIISPTDSIHFALDHDYALAARRQYLRIPIQGDCVRLLGSELVVVDGPDAYSVEPHTLFATG